jgi:hypothetical protein
LFVFVNQRPDGIDVYFIINGIFLKQRDEWLLFRFTMDADFLNPFIPT